MKETLVLVAIKGIWHADYVETAEAAKMRSLFGTTVLPMPFTTEAPTANVIAAAAKGNPQYKIWHVGEHVTHYLPEKFSNRAGNWTPITEGN